MAANPPPTFSLNPFPLAIELTTANSQKMYTKATTGSSAKFNLTNDATNAENFKQLIDEASNHFCWSTGIEEIPVKWGINDDIARTVDIRKDFRTVILTELVRGIGQRFDWCVFVDDNHDFRIINTADAAENLTCLCSLMVGEWILDSLSDNGRKTL